MDAQKLRAIELTRMMAQMAMVRVFGIIRVPIAIAVVNAIFGLATSELWPGPVGDVLFILVRVAVWAYAGWLLVAVGYLSLWKAGLAGLILFFVDHPIVKGGAFAITGEWKGVLGVMASFLMFAFVPYLVAVLGGIAARQFSVPSNKPLNTDAARNAARWLAQRWPK